MSILFEKDCELDIASITDAKSLCDTVSQEQCTGAEKRAALEVCVDTRQSGRAGWKGEMGATRQKSSGCIDNMRSSTCPTNG